MTGPPNKRLELAIALASAPRVNAKEGHFACPLSSGHRALAAQAWCSTDKTECWLGHLTESPAVIYGITGVILHGAPPRVPVSGDVAGRGGAEDGVTGVVRQRAYGRRTDPAWAERAVAS